MMNIVTHAFIALNWKELQLKCSNEGQFQTGVSFDSMKIAAEFMFEVLESSHHRPRF